MWTAISGRRRAGSATATTACRFSLRTARASVKFCCRRSAPTFASAARSATGFSWRRVSRSTRSTSRRREHISPESKGSHPAPREIFHPVNWRRAIFALREEPRSEREDYTKYKEDNDESLRRMVQWPVIFEFPCQVRQAERLDALAEKLRSNCPDANSEGTPGRIQAADAGALPGWSVVRRLCESMSDLRSLRRSRKNDRPAIPRSRRPCRCAKSIAN